MTHTLGPIVLASTAMTVVTIIDSGNVCRGTTSPGVATPSCSTGGGGAVVVVVVVAAADRTVGRGEGEELSEAANTWRSAMLAASNIASR